MRDFEPVYLKTQKEGRLAEKISLADKRLHACDLCPRRCEVDRTSGEIGICRTARKAMVSSYNAHFGEEAPLVGRNGSGTIFFTHCNLMCNFCQNYDISHEGWGEEVTGTQLAKIMLALQDQGCHNINFVTPSHVVPQILKAVSIAAKEGLRVPLIYNTGAYDDIETLKLLEGIVDIYMPDFKFWDVEIADRTCDAGDYPDVARAAILEMYRQVGDLFIDDAGIAQRGLLVRHLVLPHGLAGTRDIMRFIATQVSPHTYVNVMAQYRPCGRASEMRELSQRLSPGEYHDALAATREEGILRLDQH